MLNKKFFKTTAVIFFLLIAVVFVGLYAYNVSQQQKVRTPKKVYRAPTESEMNFVRQNIRNAIQRQQPGSNQQNLASESPERSDPERPERSDDVKPKSNKDLPKSQVSIKEDFDNLITETYTENGLVINIGHSGLLNSSLLKPTKGNPTFETNSVEELQNYISKLENSDNPKHKRMAQKFRDSLSRMKPPENDKFSISVED
ncbi:hypothetical protein F4X73_11885 [Candidatus Poribacteria bacterium]|nr:hypothetical protein [Candidatus Poribacteria bacterium]